MCRPDAICRNGFFQVGAGSVPRRTAELAMLAYSPRMSTQVHRERWRLLHQVVRFLELPMMVLGLLWIVLLSIDMVKGLNGRLAVFSKTIWVLFALDFLAELLI